MSDAGKRQSAILLGSVAVNIFLAAFVLGRLSSPATMPPPPGMDMQRMMMQQQMGGNSMQGMQPPMMMQGGPGNPGGGPPGGPGGAQNGMFRPPPPLFEPNQMFDPQEMQQAAAEVQGNFEKIQNLKKDFAEKLTQGTVTKEDILKHFTEIDGVMDNVKIKMQEKAAEKISAMSDEERRQFAGRLLERDRPPGGPQPGQMPGGMPGGMNGDPPGGPPR